MRDLLIACHILVSFHPTRRIHTFIEFDLLFWDNSTVKLEGLLNFFLAWVHWWYYFWLGTSNRYFNAQLNFVWFCSVCAVQSGDMDGWFLIFKKMGFNVFLKMYYYIFPSYYELCSSNIGNWWSLWYNYSIN